MKEECAPVGRVLIVDDEADNRVVIGLLMKARLHCEVVLAESVEQALARYESESFDLILSDYEMPKRTGIEFAQELTMRQCKIPFVLYTAHDISKWEFTKLHLVADVVSKPNIDGLFSVISRRMHWPLKPRSRISQPGKSRLC